MEIYNTVTITQNTGISTCGGRKWTYTVPFPPSRDLFREYKTISSEVGGNVFTQYHFLPPQMEGNEIILYHSFPVQITPI